MSWQSDLSLSCSLFHPPSFPNSPCPYPRDSNSVLVSLFKLSRHSEESKRRGLPGRTFRPSFVHLLVNFVACRGMWINPKREGEVSSRGCADEIACFVTFITAGDMTSFGEKRFTGLVSLLLPRSFQQTGRGRKRLVLQELPRHSAWNGEGETRRKSWNLYFTQPPMELFEMKFLRFAHKR